MYDSFLCILLEVIHCINGPYLAKFLRVFTSCLGASCGLLIGSVQMSMVHTGWEQD